MQTTFDSQYDLIKNWGLSKNVVRFNPLSQRIAIDRAIGTGYFERYEFDNTSLCRVHCQFNQTQQLTNENCQTACAVHVTLQGSSQIDLDNRTANSSDSKPETVTLSAPFIGLVKGDLGRFSTTVNANEEVKAFYIELSDTFIATLTEQLRHKADFNALVLAKLIATEGYVSLPITLNSHTETLIKKAWQLFNTPNPIDEMSFMTLQGQTLIFTSDILMQSFDKLLAQAEHSGVESNASNRPNHVITNHAYQAKLLLDEHYDQNWTIRDLAIKAGTNECYLKAQFKQLTQLSRCMST